MHTGKVRQVPRQPDPASQHRRRDFEPQNEAHVPGFSPVVLYLDPRTTGRELVDPGSVNPGWLWVLHGTFSRQIPDNPV
jgi:hypothetical protein